LEQQEAKDKIVVLDCDQDTSAITGKINQIIELKIFELYKSLMEKKKGFINSFDIQGDINKVCDSE